MSETQKQQQAIEVNTQYFRLKDYENKNLM